MAGITDKPFRRICRRLGAAMAVAEMLTSEQRLWHTNKSRLRRDLRGELEPVSVQILGTDPDIMAQAAKLNVENGAQIIDINMGCPAKKVCNVAAGSALMRDERLVTEILSAVVGAVDVPVTLKMRTGWDLENRNAVSIAKIAEDIGIAALTVHGRTRACKYNGEAEYETIAQVKQSVSIPVIANGDITSPEKAQHVLEYTKADALMIGRGAQGNPWLFKEILNYLETGQYLQAPGVEEIRSVMLEHVRAMHVFYGETMGVRIARKHVGWYGERLEGFGLYKAEINKAQSAVEQLMVLERLFGAEFSAPTREESKREYISLG